MSEIPSAQTLWLWILDGHEPLRTDDLKAWARWLDSGDDPRRVARSVIDENVEVSTVFLALDGNFTGQGPPILFETMVFGGPHDQDTWRYATWDEAEAGHARVVAWLLGGAEP